MTDKELLKQRIEDLEYMIPNLKEKIKKEYEELRELKKQLRDAKILFLQFGGKDE